MEFPSFNHHNRYVSHRPNFSSNNDRNLYPHHHLHHHHHHLPSPPPPLPFHPPPSYPTLPPAPPPPPPPPPFNPTQFTFLNHHRPIEDDSRNPHLFHLTHHLNNSPPPRVSNRALFQDDHPHPPRLRLPEFDLPYPDPRPNSWSDPPRVPPDHHHRAVSPYLPTDTYSNHDRERNSSFRDEFVDIYRENNQNQPLLWGRNRGDDDDNYRHTVHGHGRGRDHYLLNSDRNFEFGVVDSHNVVSNSNLSGDFVSEFVTEVGNYASRYGAPSEENERFWDDRDENRRWKASDAPMGIDNNEYDNGDGVPFASAKRAPHFNNRGREGREEFINTPKKQIQKKSVLLRIGKPNSWNRSHDQHFSNTSTFRGKEKDLLEYSDHRMEEKTEESPVELDVSFKSNALVAKAIVTPLSPAVVTDRNLTSRNRKIRKSIVSVVSPLTKFGEHSGKSDNSTHWSDCPSSSEKALKQSTEKVIFSGNGSVCNTGGNDSAGSSVVKGSPKVTDSDQGGNSAGCSGTLSCRVRKKKKVTTPTSHASSLQPTGKDGEPVNADSSTNSPSAPDQGIMHSKEQITSAGMVMVHDVVSLPSPHELTVNKVDESPQPIVLEKDDADTDSGRPCVTDPKRNSSTPLLGSLGSLETGIEESIDNADRSTHDLQFVSNSDRVLTELQSGLTVPEIDRVDDFIQQPCQNGVPILLENGGFIGSSEDIVSVGGNGDAGLSSPEEIKIYEDPTDSYASVHVVCNASTSDFEFIERKEDTTVSEIDFVDAGCKQSSSGEVAAPLDNGMVERYPNDDPLVGGNVIIGFTNAEETKISEGTSNADSLNHDSGSTSSSNSGLANFLGNNVVSNTCLADDTSKQSCLNGATILFENGLLEGSPKPKLPVGDNASDCSGKDYTPSTKRRRKSRNIELGLSSPRTSATPVNVANSVLHVDTTLSYSVMDLVSAEEEVSGSGDGNFPVGSKLSKDGSSGSRLNEGSSEVEVSDRGGVNGAQNGTSTKYSKKRKVFASHEKPVSEGGSILLSAKTTLDNSRINKESSPAMVSDLSINTKTASCPSQDTNKTIKSLNPMRGDLNLSRNQQSSAVPRAFTGHSSSVFTTSRKIVPTNHNSKPRTWHRTGNPTVPLPVKKSYSSPVPPQRLSPKKVGKVQSSSYIRKGNSLVRKPSPVTTLSHGSRSSRSSVYQLNPHCIDELKKSSGSESRVDVINPASCLRTGGLNASFERPKTPPLPRSIKSLDCPTINSGNFASLSMTNPPCNGGSETTSDPLEIAENVDVPKFSEDAPKCSECQTGPSSKLGSQRVLDDGNLGKKITYVKRKSNQLVAASNSSGLSAHDVDKTQLLSSDGYYKMRKNQLIRTSLESNIMQTVGIPDHTLNSEGQRVPKVISSRSSSKRQFGKGLAKMYKPSKFSSVWTLCNAQASRKNGYSLQRQKVRPHLFPWKRATYWRSFMHNSASSSNNSSLSIISRKLLLSRKRDTIYTRSTHGFSLRMSKLLSVGGSSLKWSKSIERNSKRANEEATLAVAAVEKKKREQNGAACVVAGTKSRNHFSRERIFRIGSVRYKMDPTRRTLQRISGDQEPSCSASLQSEKDTKKSYVPRRLLIGNDEYVRIGNGNQLIRDPKKRSRILASEKVRWSLHTARLRLARKRKYCQFFTRFGKCNKDDGKCPYIHDPSKIAVCTKFLNGLCSNPNCKLTHKVIPERMQDCSYFLQGLCSNENCPYRHVNVNQNASICEPFLKGYCADGNECRKKHTYVCPTFEATRICPQGSKCKLHHPKNRSKGMKRKPSREQKNAQGRYFGSRQIDMAECRTAVSENHYSKDDDNIFCQEGKFTDYITLGISDEEAGETNNPTSEQTTVSDNDPSDLQVADLDELTKPRHIMNKKLMTESSPAIDSPSEKTASYYSEESNCCK